MKNITAADIAVAVVIFGTVAGVAAARLERDPSTGARKLALRFEEINIWFPVVAAILPLLAKTLRA
jgi:hypothetical protein